MSQILMNIFSNACKFAPESNMALQMSEREEEIRIQICDHAIGIRQADLEKVFKTFAVIWKPAHVESTDSNLNVTQGLVEAHDGRIWAEQAGTSGLSPIISWKSAIERNAIWSCRRLRSCQYT